MHPLYHIKELVCGYQDGNKVLEVPDLTINAGQIMVVLGKSGSGKSTLLETLALMNNTILSGQVLFAPPSLNGSEPYDLGLMWMPSNRELLSQIRCRHFSFIFQQTNLMPNFTVFENIYLTRMLQGHGEEECRKITSEILARIGMAGVDFNRKVTELSGGQRQRVAFARAVVAGFDVLFGDEPTGNLDEVNASEILELLVEYIRNQPTARPRTAIIVSHNISMALKVADAIMLIEKTGEALAGSVYAANCFCRTEKDGSVFWDNKQTMLSEKEITDHIHQIFKS